MKKPEFAKMNSAHADLKDYCIFSMTPERKEKGDYIEVVEWSNNEGFDVRIHDVDGERKFRLTYGQFEALKDCVNLIEENDV